MDIYQQAIDKWGEDNQKTVAVEELNELAQAICKSKRGKSHNIEEEIADVEIMLEQLKRMEDVSIDLIKAWKENKLERLKERVEMDG